MFLIGTPVLTAAGDKTPPPALPLPAVHTNGSQTIRLRTPADWTVKNAPGPPEVTEARGAGLIVRILRREGEMGLDGLHVDCMLVRLAPETLTQPGAEYEFDFLTGALGDRRSADSAFVVHYDEPVEGSRDWRQRNLTVVGGGESLCVIGYAPVSAWKRKETRRLLDAVLASVEFKPWR